MKIQWSFQFHAKIRGLHHYFNEIVTCKTTDYATLRALVFSRLLNPMQR